MFYDHKFHTVCSCGWLYDLLPESDEITKGEGKMDDYVKRLFDETSK